MVVGFAALNTAHFSCLTTGGSVEAKNKNWQKLHSVYKRMKSILMTKHRNLENHRYVK